MKEYDALCERYITRQVRSFYPRKFELSQEFIDAFKLEYSRLVESGQKDPTNGAKTSEMNTNVKSQDERGCCLGGGSLSFQNFFKLFQNIGGVNPP